MARKLRAPKPGAKVKPSAPRAPAASHPGAGSGWSIAPDPDVAQLLVCEFDSPQAQHLALARIEAWYEAPAASEEEDRCAPCVDRYTPLSKAARLCANYQGFNFPVRAVWGWLRSLAMAETLLPGEDARWWAPACNEWENVFLSELSRRGACIPSSPEATDMEDARSMGQGAHHGPLYVVSTLSNAQGKGAVLAHERQHALFFFSPRYAAACRIWFPVGETSTVGFPAHWPQAAPLHTPQVTRIVQTDFQLRGYAQTVWVDEWQAHLSLPVEFLDRKEFGAKAADEVVGIGRLLRAVSEEEWARLRQDVG